MPTRSILFKMRLILRSMSRSLLPLLLFPTLANGTGAWQRCYETLHRLWGPPLMETVASRALKTRLWSDSESLTAELSTIVRRVGHTKPSDRVKLIEMLRAQPPTPGSQEQFLRLALYDRAAWLDYLHTLSASGLNSPSFLLSLRGVVEKMPRTLRDELLAWVGQKHGEAEKRNRTVFPPKQALELFVRTALPAKKEISEAIAQGASPSEAFRHYYEKLQNTVYKSHPDRPDIRFDDLLYWARATQKALIETEAQLRGSKQMRGHPARLTLVGSIVNGSARHNSDLDILAPTQTLAAHAIPRINAQLTKHWQARNMAAADLIIKPIDQNHYTMPDHLRALVAVVAPLQIEVTPSEIRLHIYSDNVPSPETVERRYREAGDFAELVGRNYRIESAPEVYVLEQRAP